MKKEGVILINSGIPPSIPWAGRVLAADLSAIASESKVDLSIPLAGASAKAIKVIGLTSLEQVIRKTYTGEERKRGLAALRRGFEAV